ATTPELPFPDKPVPASLPSNASIGGCKQGSIQGQVLRGTPTNTSSISQFLFDIHVLSLI
ncbi:MAG TPA: hypothetical protein VJ084_06140, partial [Nitrospinota bacterium]|nr:hypothetical protein [Nitrospinota bacterium]